MKSSALNIQYGPGLQSMHANLKVLCHGRKLKISICPFLFATEAAAKEMVLKKLKVFDRKVW